MLNEKTIYCSDVYRASSYCRGGLDQILSRNFGGESTIELEEGQRLENVTWKDTDSLWLLIKNAPEQKPTTYEFREVSVFGVLEGTVRIIEK